MAIQLNERDKLIFNLLDEHHVLLEKHISWFIADTNKPVLIRDRLRKLFYLDYLSCQRHPDTLPWWTTPTKPLVYALSPLTREIIGATSSKFDLTDSDIQRHLLEIANLRMLFLVDQYEGLISNLEWNTCKETSYKCGTLDAKVSFEHNGAVYSIGVVNTPINDSATLDRLEQALSLNEISMLWIVSRDETHQTVLQHLVAANANIEAQCVFATHQELYKSGIVKSNWQNAQKRKICPFKDSDQTIDTIRKIVRA